MAKSVVGVFPYDGLPKNIKRLLHGVIVNTDPHDKPGDHWVAIYIDKSNRGEFFCSFGFPVTFYNKYFMSYYKDHGIKTVTSNETRLQSDILRVCGYYTVYYLAHRCNNIALSKIVEDFDNVDFHLNDTYIEDYIVNTYSCCF